MKNEVVSIEVPNIGTINISSRMKCESKGTRMFNIRHFIFTLRIWSDNGKMECSFHDSGYNYSKNVRKMDRESLLNAMDCILSDISMYLNDEIKWNYDDEDAALMKRAEKGCKLEMEKFTKVVGGEDNIWPAIEFITDYIREND